MIHLTELYSEELLQSILLLHNHLKRSMKNLVFFLFVLTALPAYSQNTVPQNIFELQQTLQISSELQTPVMKNSDSPERKSPALAILYSALIPGMGELYAGDYTSGKYLTITEGALWLTYFSINQYGEWQEESYLSFAKTRGGVVTEGKDEDFFANIGNYRDIHQFNDERAFYRQFDEMYNTTTHYWSWSSTTERRTYRSMWVSSRQAFNNLRFVVAGMLLNRLGSVINAVRLVSAHNKGLQAETTLLEMGQGIAPDGSNQYSFGLRFGF